MKKIMSSKQIDKFLKDYFGKHRVIKTNISGCRFWSKKGFPDYYIIRHGFIEIKRGSEKLTNDQMFWLVNLDSRVWRFWPDRIEIWSYSKKVSEIAL